MDLSRRSVGTSFTPSSDRRHSRITAQALAHHSELHLLREYLHKWRNYAKEEQLRVHLKRCAVQLKHSNNRQQYSRYFLRWLAAVQQTASQEARAAITVPKDVPLRSKRDYLSLVRRYFRKWRLYHRQLQQRTHANVALVQRVNEQRERSRVFATWREFARQRREAAHAAEVAALHQQNASLEARITALATQHNDLLSTHHRLQQEVQQLQDSLIDLEAERTSLCKDIADVKAAAVEAEEHATRQLQESESKRQRAERDHEHEKTIMTCELNDLSEAALLAVDTLSGGGLDLSPYVVKPSDSREVQAERSTALSDALHELAAGLVQVLASASMWSKEGVGHTLTESLEQLKRREHKLQQEQTILTDKLAQANATITSAVALLETSEAEYTVPPPDVRRSATDVAQRASDVLESEAPCTLMECCVQTVERLVTTTHALDQRSAEVAVLREAATSTLKVLRGPLAKPPSPDYRVQKGETCKESDPRSRAAAAALTEASTSLQHTMQSTATHDESVESALRDLWGRAEDLQREKTALSQELNDCKEELAAEKELNAYNNIKLSCFSSVALDVAGMLRQSNTGKKAPPATLAKHTVEAAETLEQDGVPSANALVEEGTQVVSLLSQARGAIDERVVEVSALRDAAALMVSVLGGDKGRADAASLRAQPRVAPAESQKRSRAAVDALSDLAAALSATLEAIGEKDAQSESAELPVSDVLQHLSARLREAQASNVALAAELAAEKDHASHLSEKLACVDVVAQAAADVLARSLKGTIPLPLPPLEKQTVAVADALAKDGVQSARTLLQDVMNVARVLQQTREERDGRVSEVGLLRDAAASTIDILQGSGPTAPEYGGYTSEPLEVSQRHTAAAAKALLGLTEMISASLEATMGGDGDASVSETLRKLWSRNEGLQSEKAAVEAMLAQRMQQLTEEQANAARLHNDLEHLTSSLQTGEEQLTGLIARLEEAETYRRSLEAVGGFLVDVLRDFIERLAQLTAATTGTGDAAQSPRVSLALSGGSPPALSDNPSAYVEYILQYVGTGEEEKRAVQDHLSSEAVIATQAGATSAPSTWDVVAELHERLLQLMEATAHRDDFVVEQREREEVLLQENARLSEAVQQSLHHLRTWPRDPTEAEVPEEQTADPALMLVACAKEVGEALRSLKGIAEHTKGEQSGEGVPTAGAGHPLNSSGGGIDSVGALVHAVRTMERDLCTLQGSVEEGIAALTGVAPAQPPPRASAVGTGGGGGGERPRVKFSSDCSGSADVQSETLSPSPSQSPEMAALSARRCQADGTVENGVLSEQLRVLCQETGDSIEEARELLGIPAERAKSMKLKDLVAAFRAKIAELETVRKDSEALVRGLDRAFNDDDSFGSSSAASFTSKSVKPKKKPLPAYQGRPRELIAMTLSMRGHSRPRKGPGSGGQSPESRMQELRSTARNKLEEVQDLNQACRAAIQVLEGSQEEGEKPTAYGEVLVPMLLTQLEELKRALPVCDDALASDDGVSPLAGATVGTRLTMLANSVRSLKLEREGLREELAGKTRQNMMLLSQLNAETERLKAAVEDAHHELEEQEARQEVLHQEMEEREAVAQARVAEYEAAQQRLQAQLQEELEEGRQLSARAVRHQHEANVLVGALARLVRTLPIQPSAETGVSLATTLPSDVEAHIVQVLKSEDDEEGIAHLVDHYRSHLRSTLGSYQHALQALRAQLVVLREAVTSAWTDVYQPVCYDVMVQVDEATELLQRENDLLRPRALEREALRGQNAEQKSVIADLETKLAATAPLAEEVVRLRRQVREQGVRLAMTDGADEAEQSHQNNGQHANASPFSTNGTRIDLEEMESRMIRGATNLTMEAIDSISGVQLAHTFGQVAEDAVHLYHGVMESLYQLQDLYNSSALNGGEQRGGALAGGSVSSGVFRTCVAQQLRELQRWRVVADRLWKQTPTLFRPPYCADTGGVSRLPPW